MPDVSQLSDAELMHRLQAPTPQADVSALSDEELMQRLQTTQEPYSGSFLPFSRDAEGNVSFDSDAGIVGTIKRAVTLPGDVMTGKVDPLSDEAIERSTDLGAIATPMNPAVRSTGAALPNMKPRHKEPDVPVPSAKELKQVGSEGFDAVRDSGVTFSSDAIKSLAQGLKQDLDQDGILANLAPKTHKIVRQLSNPPDGSVAPIQGIVAARRALARARKDFNNPTEQEAARRVAEGLDKFLQSPDPRSVVAGPAAAAGKQYSEANANYAAGKRSDAVTAKQERAELRAAAANSGQNIDNTLRQRVVDILADPKQRAGFSKRELSAMEKFARGDKRRNLARFVSNLLGGGGGMGGMVASAIGGAAGSAFGPLGAAAGAAVPIAAGRGMKAYQNARSMGEMDALSGLMRKRSPLYEEAMREAPAVPHVPRHHRAAVRSLMTIRPPDQQ